MNSLASRRDWIDIALVLFSAAGILSCLALALLVVILALTSLLQGGIEDALTAEWGALGFGFMALGGLPALYWSGRAVLGYPSPQPSRPSRKWGWILLLLPLSLALGHLAGQSSVLAAVVGPVAQLAAASIPVGLVVLLVRRIGPPVRPRRAWGQFLLGLWVSPAAAMLAELVLLLPVAGVAFLALGSSIEGRALLEALRNPVFSPDSFADLIAAVAVKPWAIGLALFYGAFLVPLIEEALKTIGVWPLLLTRLPSVGEGYLSGVLTGAGFALAEALFVPQPGSLWLAGILVRAAGTVIHAYTGGLSCWGAVESFQRRRLGPWLRRYAAAVFLHGVWNAAVLLILVMTLAFEADVPGISYAAADGLTLWSSVALILLVLVALVGLPLAARRTMRLGSPEAPPTPKSP
ncbi:MAG: PrsW family glutamic-type intramembrane protease [Chloroflexota bacterium]